MYTWKLCLNVKQNLKIIKMYARVLVCVCVFTLMDIELAYFIITSKKIIDYRASTEYYNKR